MPLTVIAEISPRSDVVRLKSLLAIGHGAAATGYDLHFGALIIIAVAIVIISRPIIVWGT
jgi:hypothetical protein